MLTPFVNVSESTSPASCPCCNRRGFLATAASFLLVPVIDAVAEKVHVVTKGETLYGLSRKYAVNVADLAKANGISKRTKIKIGQRLSIPNAHPDVPTIPSSLKRSLDRVSVKSNRWKHIVIHHSATKVGTIKGMDEYHRRRGMENGLAYHFVIGNGHGMGDGEVGVGNRWDKQLQGGHLASEWLNQISLGICLVGNFDVQKPTHDQMESLAALTSYLRQRCRLPLSSIKTHQQINPVPTKCPGKHFSKNALVGLLA